jgi:hypothetical protein
MNTAGLVICLIGIVIHVIIKAKSDLQGFFVLFFIFNKRIYYLFLKFLKKHEKCLKQNEIIRK